MAQKLLIIAVFAFFFSCFSYSLPFPSAFAQGGVSSEEGIDSPYYTFPLMIIVHPDIAKETVMKWREEGIDYLFRRIVELLASVIGSLTVLVMSYGGLLMMLSMGDEGRYTKGKSLVRYSVIGLVFALSAYVLVLGVELIIQGIYA
jgi:hypothetical protein